MSARVIQFSARTRRDEFLNCRGQAHLLTPSCQLARVLSAPAIGGGSQRSRTDVLSHVEGRDPFESAVLTAHPSSVSGESVQIQSIRRRQTPGLYFVCYDPDRSVSRSSSSFHFHMNNSRFLPPSRSQSADAQRLISKSGSYSQFGYA